MKKILKILIVDDSSVIREYLYNIISAEPDMHIVATAKNGKEAVKLAALKKPDVITMDINMPQMNGYEATAEIMEHSPTPIIVVSSSYDPQDKEKVFKSIEAGAIAILAKPVGMKHKNFQQDKEKLLTTIRTMSEVKVVTRKRKQENKMLNVYPAATLLFNEKKTRYRIIGIGVSTGGPQVLNTMLPLFPEDFNIPIVVVQHIPAGFLEGMVEWLSQKSSLKLKIAEQSETLVGGTIYFCPPEYNIKIRKDMKVDLTSDSFGFMIKPSVSYMFKTLGNSFDQQSIGILLSGMGKDGAEELAIMKERGALTIVQDEESSIIFGMPGEAVKLNAHRYTLPPERIVNKLKEIDKNNRIL